MTGRNIRGHQYVTAIISFRGHTIPFGIRLYVKKQDCRYLGLDFKKTTQLAAELISEFKPPQGLNVRVLFVSYYLCPVVVKSCRKKSFRFVSTLKSNRNLYKNGRKLKAGGYGSPGLSEIGKLNKTADIINADKRVLLSRTAKNQSSDHCISCNLKYFLEKVFPGF